MIAPNPDRLRVLVVDDDDLNRRMMRLILSREDLEIDIAASGFEALELVKSHDFDIILMDLQMPEMDGVETSRRIRAYENSVNHPYIVALTASYLPEKGHELFQAGIDNYIAKPFDVEHLRQMLQHGLDRREVSPQKIQILPSIVENGLDGLSFNPAKGILQTGGDEAGYRELLSDFVGELPGKVYSLSKHFNERDTAALERVAHNIKGVAANLGALQLSEYAGKLEKHAGEGYTYNLENEIKKLQEISDLFILDATSFLGKFQ